jgi:hypothetical protein
MAVGILRMRLGKVGCCQGTLMGHTGRMRNVHSWKLLNQLSNTGMRGHLWYLGILDHVNGRAQSVLCREHYSMDKKRKKGQLGVGNHRTSSPSLGSGGCFLGLALLLFLRGDNN